MSLKTSGYNKFMNDILKTKNKELVNKSGISAFIYKSNLDKNIKALAMKAEVKAEQDKIVKLQRHDLSCFLDKICFGDIFVYQLIFNMSDLKKDKCTDYVICWKSKGLRKSELLPLHGAFLPNIKYFGYKIRIQFSNTPLVVEQKDYVTKTVNAYIIYNLNNWPKIPLNNFTSKNRFFGATNIVKTSKKK